MHIIPYKTKAVHVGDDLFAVLKSAIANVPEKSVVCISSKIIALCQRDVEPLTTDKQQLIHDECEWYLPAQDNPFGFNVTITGHKLAAASGIDESNVQNAYVLLPSNVQQTAQAIVSWLRKTYGIKHVGVLVVDSRSLALNIGTIGQSIAWAGFLPLKDYRGKKDIFSREMQFERLSIVSCLASSAVLTMGEGDEQTPLAIASDITGIEFSAHAYSGEPLEYEWQNDVYVRMFDGAGWLAGGRGYLARQEQRRLN